MKHFNDACSIIEKVDRSYADRLRNRAENYLAFLSYPSEVGKKVCLYYKCYREHKLWS